MTDTPTTLLVLAGGIMVNQLTKSPSIQEAVEAKCPWVVVLPLNDIGYMVGQVPNIVGRIREAMQGHSMRVVVVDHSMGWIAGKHAALAGLVDYLIALDPVGVPGVSHDVWPHLDGVRQPGEFWKASSMNDAVEGIAQLDISDGPPIINRDVEHNALTRLQDVFDAVVAACSVQPLIGQTHTANLIDSNAKD